MKKDNEVTIPKILFAFLLNDILKEVDCSCELPSSPGVYLFFYKEDGQPAYVGRSMNIRRRVRNNHHIYDPDKHKIAYIAADPEYIADLEKALYDLCTWPENGTTPSKASPQELAP